MIMYSGRLSADSTGNTEYIFYQKEGAIHIGTGVNRHGFAESQAERAGLKKQDKQWRTLFDYCVEPFIRDQVLDVWPRSLLFSHATALNFTPFIVRQYRNFRTIIDNDCTA